MIYNQFCNNMINIIAKYDYIYKSIFGYDMIYNQFCNNMINIIAKYDYIYKSIF